MKARSWIVAAALALVADTSTAQSALGRWNVRFDSDLGPVAYSLEFRLNDQGKLVGSMTNEFGSIPIEDGAIDGNAISYKLTLDFGNGPVRFVYDGVVEGDEIRMISTFDDPPPGLESAEVPFTAKRAE